MRLARLIIATPLRVERRPAPAQSRGLAVAKPCLACGVLTEGSCCAAHRPRRPRGRQLAQLRRRVFATYGRRCADCGRSDVPLEVHHVNGDPMDNRISNTIPLCSDCHRSPDIHR